MISFQLVFFTTLAVNVCGRKYLCVWYIMIATKVDVTHTQSASTKLASAGDITVHKDVLIQAYSLFPHSHDVMERQLTGACSSIETASAQSFWLNFSFYRTHSAQSCQFQILGERLLKPKYSIGKCTFWHHQVSASYTHRLVAIHIAVLNLDQSGILIPIDTLCWLNCI